MPTSWCSYHADEQADVLKGIDAAHCAGFTSIKINMGVKKGVNAEMPLIEVQSNYSGEVAQRWTYADGSGEIGVISRDEGFSVRLGRHKCENGNKNVMYYRYFCTYGVN